MQEVSQILEIEGIGPITIKRRRGQKSTTLRLSRKGEIVLGTNYSTPLYMLKKFALENRSWLENVKTKAGFHDAIEIYDSQQLSSKLKFEIAVDGSLDGDEKKFSYRKGADKVVIKVSKSQFGSDFVSLEEDERRDLDKQVVRALRYEAKEYLPPALKEVSRMMGVEYSSVTIRDTSSRWGSCSASNDINLSLWLMILPKDLIIYVLVHELAHVTHKHHGKEFWDEVKRWIPNHKELRLRLKKHSAQVWW
jgi:predicted metal-dependent hydrolase